MHQGGEEERLYGGGYPDAACGSGSAGLPLSTLRTAAFVAVQEYCRLAALEELSRGCRTSQGPS